MEASRRAEGQRLVPQVLQLLLGLVEHLHALGVLVLQLSQLTQEVTEREVSQTTEIFISGVQFDLI